MAETKTRQPSGPEKIAPTTPPTLMVENTEDFFCNHNPLDVGVSGRMRAYLGNEMRYAFCLFCATVLIFPFKWELLFATQTKQGGGLLAPNSFAKTETRSSLLMLLLWHEGFHELRVSVMIYYASKALCMFLSAILWTSGGPSKRIKSRCCGTLWNLMQSTGQVSVLVLSFAFAYEIGKRNSPNFTINMSENANKNVETFCAWATAVAAFTWAFFLFFRFLCFLEIVQ